MRGTNAVQYDRQWVRRIMREEKTILDAINVPPEDINPEGYVREQREASSPTPSPFFNAGMKR